MELHESTISRVTTRSSCPRHAAYWSSNGFLRQPYVPPIPVGSLFDGDPRTIRRWWTEDSKTTFRRKIAGFI